MKNIQTNGALKVKAGVKAGGLATANHNRGALRVKAAVKAAGLATANHNRRALALA